MKEEKHKCYYDMESKYRPCNGMNIMLNNESHIECPPVMSFTGVNAGRERDAFVIWKGNKKNKIKGISFNVCPFCGEDILNNKRQLCTNKIPLYTALRQ